MVHRQTGAASAFRAYDGGGARALIDKIDDGTLMQSMMGQGMKGESFSPSSGGGKSKGPEAPQNYGFTSVVAKASKGAGGMIKQCAEGFMSFMGGNRSFPVGAMMDDRRHRLKNLIKDAAEGSTAMHGMKEWGQQFLMTDNGVFLTGNAGQTQGGGGGSSGGAGVAATAAAGGSGSGGSGQKENFKIRLALVENQNGKTQQQSSSSGAKQLARTFQTGSGVEFEIETYVLNEDESRLYNAEIAKGKSVAEAERIVEARAGRIQTLAGGDGGSSGGSSSGGTGAAGSSKPTGQKTLHKEKSETNIDMTKDAIKTQRGDGYMHVTGDISQTYHKDPKHDTRCDDSHVHIGWDDDSKVWVNKDGCWSSKPIQLRKCMDKSASSSSSSSGARATVDDPHPPAFSGPPPYYMDSPFATGQDAKLQFALTDPLAVMLTIDVPVDNYSGFGDPIIHPLGLKFKSPLYLDPADGFLTSTGGGAGGVPEAPADGLMYGRQSLGGTPAWQRALAITGDVLDGGNF